MSTFIATDDVGRPIPALGLGAASKVEFTVSPSVQSASLDHKIIRVISDVDCYITTGVNPVSTVSSTFLPERSAEYFKITPGNKVGVIGSTSGFLSITGVG